MTNKRYGKLLLNIKKLDPNLVKGIEDYVKGALILDESKVQSNSKANVIINLLDSLIRDNYKPHHIKRLKEYIFHDWNVIRDNKLLSKFIKQAIIEFEKPTNNHTIFKNKNKDARAGYKFEELFTQLLEWYISVQPGMVNKSKLL